MIVNMTRRHVMRGMVSGAVGLALAPSAMAALGPPEGIVHLVYNENPYGPSPRALEAANNAAKNGAYYPVRISGMLVDAIAEKNGVERDHVVISSGSNEALQAAATGWGRFGRIVTPGLTYTDYVAYSKRQGVEFATVPLKADLSIDLERMAAAVDNSVSLVYVCNPNNPTGRTLDGDELRAFCRSVGKKALVIVDEAYNELTDKPDYTSVVDLVREGENVVVMRTFSKIFGMAGMRVGYGLARPDIASAIADRVMAWPNGVGMAAAHASYNDESFIRFSRDKVIEGREMVNATFQRNGIEPVPSQTNFVFADLGRNADEFRDRMLARNVRIRGGYGAYSTYTRVSMGRLEDLEIFDRVFTETYNA